MAIVTRDSLQALVDSGDFTKTMHVVGRACVALYKRQTDSEQQGNVTTEHNAIGFSATDAKCGSLTAKSYLRNKRLDLWQVNKWTKRSERTGYSRIVKYHRQLNEVAELKRSQS